MFHQILEWGHEKAIREEKGVHQHRLVRHRLHLLAAYVSTRGLALNRLKFTAWDVIGECLRISTV
jgi:hypothetical protein